MSLQEKFAQSGLTLSQISKEIGKGASTVSGIIKGSYSSANKELYETAVEKILDRALAKKGAKAEDEWLSYAQIKVKDRLERMRKSGLSFFELITGESGMGKTHLLERVCQEKGSVYVKARRSLSAAAFAAGIARALGENPKGNADDKLEQIIEAVREQNIKLLVVDEADLFVRDNDFTFERKFEMLREIFETSKHEGLGVSVVAVGLPSLAKRIIKLGGYLQSSRARE